MTDPLVSVYIPTHNRPELLQRALSSIEQQTYSNIEVLVVDDGSELPVSKAIPSLLASKKVQLIRNDTPMGACYSRNRAIEQANGQLITGLDDDDAFAPERISELVTAFNASPNLSCVASCIKEISINGPIVRQFDHGLVTNDMMLHYNFLGNQVLTKTEYLRAIKGFDETLPAMQDYDTWVRLTDTFGPALKLKSASYYWYTDHEYDRITSNNSKRIRAFEVFLKKHSTNMNSSQLKSMRVLRTKILQERMTFVNAIRWANRYNYRSIIAMLINQQGGAVKKLIDTIRRRPKV